MRNIILYGKLAKKYGRRHRLDVQTAAEAVRAMAANYPEFMKDIREGSWHVVRGEHIDKGVDLDIEQYAGLSLGDKDIHIAPYIAGSKRGGILKILLGVAMIATGFAFGLTAVGGMGAPAFGGALGGVTYGNMAIMGTILALGGVAQMLAPESNNEEESQSYIMNGPGNTSSQGVPVPVVYGEVITGGVLVSGGIDVEKIPASGGGGRIGGGK